MYVLCVCQVEGDETLERGEETVDSEEEGTTHTNI